MTQLIDGSTLAKEIQAEVAAEVVKLKRAGIHPGLAVVLVGENPASQVYVRGKVRTCLALGMHSEKYEMSAGSTTEEILAVVQSLNDRADIHGILVQTPLPPQVNAREIVEAILPDKDVDGFHPVNMGRLVAKSAVLKPCTPAGIMEIFRRYRLPVRGRRAVVIGRSDIVGKPVALLLLHEDATVTLCHSKTEHLAQISRDADILIVAIGKPAGIDDSYIKPGAVVIDVGINRLDSIDRIRDIFGEDPARLEEHSKKGYTLVGDVHPRLAPEKASYLTPVPGGVGPLTVAMLMANTVRAAAAVGKVDVFDTGGVRSRS